MTEPARGGTGPGFHGHAHAPCAELVREGARGSPLRIADVHASRVPVPGERERGGERDVVAGEVVPPAGRPPIAQESCRGAHHPPPHLHDP